MPRAARIKSEDSMYHIMCRSISEINLFQSDEDKAYYLTLLKRYKEMHNCKIYAYCVMDNHVHFYINPCKFDISTFMRCVNSAYVSHFNKIYDRHGTLFQGRFASSIVDNDTYSLTLSAYIHNNAKDLPGYAGKEEFYQYSSYGIYTGYRKDIDGLLDTEFLLEIFSEDASAARNKFKAFTESMRDTGIMKEVDENIMRSYTENEYRSEKKQVIRYQKSDELLSKISEILGEKLSDRIRTKHSRETSKNRAFTVYAMRTLCGYTYKKICETIGNMSMSGISRLSTEGFKLLKREARYQNAFNSLIHA
jgi:REP element-mobilizing transposase RayT